MLFSPAQNRSAAANAPDDSARLAGTLLLICLVAAFLLGTWLRLDQFLDQTLIDDEWHAVHQLMLSSPSQFTFSFGQADFSIPLTLWYWLVARWLGLSELGMRLPMMLAGLATLIIFPMALRGRLNDRVLLLFALFLACSPLLISYSRMARPYAITLLLSVAAYWCLACASSTGTLKWRHALGYVLLSALVLWMHPITGPFLVAPLLALWWQWLRGNRSALPVASLASLSLITGAMMALAVLPPLLSDPAALTGKSGVHSVTWGTIEGVWYAWLGTGSTVVVALAMILAAMGAPSVWRTSPIIRWAVLGLALTSAVLLVTQPAWILHPLTLARYLLPAVPLILLCVAAGMVRLVDTVSARGHFWGLAARRWGFLAPLIVVPAWWVTSPLPAQLRTPNSNTLHVVAQLDFRDGNNAVIPFLNAFPISPFWATLANAPAGSMTIAVAPFRFEGFDWPAPVWESVSKQRVIPAFLSGSCEKWLHGNAPHDARFAFRNAVYVDDPAALRRSKLTYLAFFRAARSSLTAPDKPFLPQCETWLREKYGIPFFEDASLVVWKIQHENSL